MLLRRATGPIQATITPPPSKSITHRALVAAALRGGTTVIQDPLDAEDTRLTAAALTALGAPVDFSPQVWTVTGSRQGRPGGGGGGTSAGSGGVPAAGRGSRGAGGPMNSASSQDAGPGDSEPDQTGSRSVSAAPIRLNLGNSGTSLRLLLPLAALGDVPVVLDGSPRLRRRPLGAQIAALRVMGARVDELGEPGCPPVRICGPLRGGEVEVDATASSQVVSGLLLAGAGLDDRLTVRALGLSSRPYVDLTAAVMADFGFRVDERQENIWTVQPGQAGMGLSGGGPARPGQAGEGPSRHGQPGGGQTSQGQTGEEWTGAGRSPFTYKVEPDASAAAFLMAAGVVTGGRVEIAGVGTRSLQGDIAFLDDLACMGCKVAANARSLVAGGRPTSGIRADLNATPDLVPALAAVALLAPGPSRLTGIGHLRGKESDRLAALAEEFSRLGGQVTAGSDYLEIIPAPLHGAAVSAHDDHRIAMALAIVGLCVDGVDLDDPACVGKSYPDFFRDLDRIMAG